MNTIIQFLYKVKEKTVEKVNFTSVKEAISYLFSHKMPSEVKTNEKGTGIITSIVNFCKNIKIKAPDFTSLH